MTYKQIGPVTIWEENGLLYIRTEDGKTTGLNEQQTTWLREDLRKALRKGNKVIEVDFRKYGREDGTP